MRPESDRAAIAAMGQGLGPDVLVQVYDMFGEEQALLAEAQPAAAIDLAYGPDVRQRLDLYRISGNDTRLPILVWVHGGGFLRGDKQANHVFNAHVGRLAARAGFLGVVINYRLAPDHRWPSGGDDVGLALDWLSANAGAYGGDPAQIVLAGTSAGSVHIATFLRRGRPSVAGAVLLSGLYGLTPLDDRDLLYFGEDRPEHATADALAAIDLPLFVCFAEHDPARFQAEALGLLQRRLAARGTAARAAVAIGHNHYSAACHLGGRDHRLTDEIIAFARQCVGQTGEPA